MRWAPQNKTKDSGIGDPAEQPGPCSGAGARGEAEPQEEPGSARRGIKSSPHPPARQCQQRWPQTEARPRSQGVPTPE